ncbi:unnamed protein product, partial [Ectocarpus sp. 12 AP-2014]
MYRLLSTGTLEESIFQRQIFKGALYDLIHDSNDDPSKESGGGGGGRGFSQEELKELFVLKTETRSDTYDKLR